MKKLPPSPRTWQLRAVGSGRRLLTFSDCVAVVRRLRQLRDSERTSRPPVLSWPGQLPRGTGNAGKTGVAASPDPFPGECLLPPRDCGKGGMGPHLRRGCGGRVRVVPYLSKIVPEIERETV